MDGAVYPVVHMSIDMQQGCLRYLKEACAERLTQNSNAFIAELRERGVPTLAVGLHSEPPTPVYCVTAQRPFVQPADEFTITIKPGDMYIFKDSVSALYNPHIVDALKEWGTRHVIVTGVFLDACAGHTALDIRAAGMQCSVPLDVASYSMLINPFTKKPHSYATDCNTPEFFEVSRLRFGEIADHVKAKLRPALTSRHAVLGMLDPARTLEKRTAAPGTKPLTLQLA